MGAYEFLSEQEREGVRLFASRVRELLGDNLLDLRLFGSKARGDFDAESDIDILLIVREKNFDMRYAVCSIAGDMLLEYGANIAPKFMTDKEFGLNRGTLFYESVEKEGAAI